MIDCSFCGKTLKPGTGKMFVKKDGKIFYFCSNKCEKNTFKLKRKPIKTRWSKHFKKETIKKEQPKKEVAKK